MQFMEFLKNRKFSYFEKIENKKFENIDKNLYEELIKEYIEKYRFQENYNFSDAVFFDIGIFKKFYHPTKSLVFKNSIFIKRIRFDNIVCKELVFKDCEFLDGGGIKNKGKKALKIKKLVFEPYRLDGDFVIDIGKYAGERGIEVDSEGIIEEIKFENNQVGNGRVFFIGLNKYLKKGDFRNRILDNVIFQNCDLRNCYFLNSRVEKTEFRNVLFPQFLDYDFFIVRNNTIEKNSILIMGIALLFVVIFVIVHILINSLNDNNFFIVFVYAIILLMYILFLGSIDIFLIKILNFFNFKDKDGFYIMNYHFGVKDEEDIIENIKEKNFLKVKETIKSLTDLYSQLANNLSKKDAQISGEFIYSNKLFKSYIFYNFFEIFINKFHHFINGFGQRWLRVLFHFIVTILFFSWIFVYIITPNKDYISTYNTPYFLLENIKEKNSTIIYNKSSFVKTLYKCEKNCSIENNSTILYGYDNRYNFNGVTKQKIFKLKENNLIVGFYKSLSNLFYPFSFESKKWFQNISQKAIFVSFLETILLWIFLIAFFKALWNRLKF